MNKRLVKDFLICLSLANFFLLRSWHLEELYSDPANYYFLKFFPPWQVFVGMIIDSLVVTLIFFIGSIIVKRSKNKTLKNFAKWCLFFIICSSVLGIVKDNEYFTLMKNKIPAPSWALPGFILASSLFYWVSMRLHAATKIFLTVLLISSPFAFINYGQALWLMTIRAKVVREALRDIPLSPVTSSNLPFRRVVWMIFDELDEFQTFSGRSHEVQLPELDRLKAQSIFSENALAPADETLLSIPSLLLERRVTQAKAVDSNTLSLSVTGPREEKSFSEFDNIFKKIKRLGRTAGVVGWYHPYCRLFGDSLSACSWYNSTPQANKKDISLSSSLVQKIRPSFWPFFIIQRHILGYPPQQNDLKQHINSYERILQDSILMLQNPNLDLIFIHWPIPHAPAIFDPESGTLTTKKHLTYQDNLALVDKTLGEIRKNMEENGTWDNSLIVVSSDHHWRDATHIESKIPFLIKLPGQHVELIYEKPVNTIITQGLILDFLEGKLNHPGEVVRWLDKH